MYPFEQLACSWLATFRNSIFFLFVFLLIQSCSSETLDLSRLIKPCFLKSFEDVQSLQNTVNGIYRVCI
jgi:hypothetical protein